MHAKPCDPQARGKMERVWSRLRQQCIAPMGAMGSLHDVQVRLSAWLEKHYLVAPHAGLLGSSPEQVLSQPHDGDNELAHAQGVVSELFRRRGNWTLVVHGQDERGVWGHVVRRAMTTEVARVSLFWWATRDGQVGFSHRNWDSDPEFIEDWFEPTP